MRRMRLSSRLTFCAMILLLYFISNLKADHVSALWVILAEEDCASCALIGTVSCATRTYRIDPCHNDLPVRCEARRRCSSYKTRRDTCDCIYRKSKFCFDIASGWNRWAFGCCTQDTRGKSSWFGLIWDPFLETRAGTREKLQATSERRYSKRWKTRVTVPDCGVASAGREWLRSQRPFLRVIICAMSRGRRYHTYKYL